MVLALTITLLLVKFAVCHTDSLFSGFYNPPRHELYAASWIAPKSLFMKAKAGMLNINSLEGNTQSVLAGNEDRSLMTRDYLDFFVYHLSSTTNQLLNYDSDDMLIQQMMRKVKHYRKYVLGQGTNLSPFSNDTIAIMPFSMHTYRPRENPMMRSLFFELTYLSVYLHFPKIAVAIQDDEHWELLQKMRIPAPFHVFRIQYDKDNAQDYYLMKKMMISLHDALGEGSGKWGAFSRVFFTECDQIVHLRMRQVIHDTMTNAQDAPLLIPHRMQTLGLPKEMSDKSLDADKRVPNATVVIEDPLLPKGSCCDDGRYEVVNGCGNFWYNCKQAYSDIDRTWLRFGANGFTIPTATEHLGKCVYSAHKKVCNLPPGCKLRVPLSLNDKCGEVPIALKIMK